MRIKFLHLNHRGDTLVEVLLSIAVAGAVITGSYALASHSLSEGITSAERTQALKVAESQIETLKFRKQKSTADQWKDNFQGSPSGSVQNFCLDTDAIDPTDDASWLPLKNGSSPDNLTSGSGGNYTAKCIKDSKYFINIISGTSSGNSTANPTFLVTVRWNAIGGTNQINQSQLYYRVFDQ